MNVTSNNQIIYHGDLETKDISTKQELTNQASTFAPLFVNEQHYNCFAEDILIEELISYLYGKFIITKNQYDELSTEPTRYKKIELLINFLNNILENSTKEGAQQLIKTLFDGVSDRNICNQHFLALILIGNIYAHKLYK